MKRFILCVLALIVICNFNAYAEENQNTNTIKLDVGRQLVKTNSAGLDPYYVLESAYTDANGEVWYDTYSIKNTQLRAADCTVQDYVEVETDDPTRQALIVNAFQKLGNPYAFSRSGPDVFDCSGFACYTYGTVGVPIPRSSYSICVTGVPVAREQLRTGDIVGTPGHVGIYIGNGIFIHAQDRASGVVTDYIDYYNSHSSKPFTRYQSILE